jgi:uncharacterized protein YrrD
MRIELGAHVRTSDDQDVGAVDRLILDPESHTVKAVVIRKGLLLARDVAIPLEAMTIGERGDIRLDYTADQVDEMPEFIEADYVTPPLEYVPRTGYPATGLYWPTAYGVPELGAPSADEALYRQNLENAVVGEGSDVLSKDGEMLGQIHRLTFDEDTGRLIGIVVRQGLIFTEDVELPASLVASVDDGMIYLTLNAAEAQAMLG